VTAIILTARSRGTSIVTAPRLSAATDNLGKRAARLSANGIVVPLYLALDAVPPKGHHHR
jgi:hypothetical protein